MKKIDFNRDWYVQKAGADGRHKVNLPHDAMLAEKRDKLNKSLAGGAYFDGGKYCYTKNLQLPEAWQDKTIMLECEGIYQNAEIRVNGTDIYYRPYGYSDFFVDLTSHLEKDKENVIEIVADNSEIPNSRWYSGSGIYREVSLYVGGKCHIIPDGIRVTAIDGQTVLVETKIVGEGNIGVEIWDKEEKIAEGKGNPVKINIPDAKGWCADTPKLYTCKARVNGADGTFDEAEVKFGLRVLSWDKGGLSVNGKTELLRGACIHHDNGVLGACGFRDAEYRRVRILKEAGFNAIRSAHNPISKAMLDACDELGMYVMDETFDFWLVHKNPHDYANEKFREWWKTDTDAMIQKDYNHPSVIMYSIGNEISELGTAEGQKLCNEMSTFVKEKDSTRAVTCGINLMLASMSAKGGGIYGEKKKGKENTNGSAGMDSMPTSAFYNLLMNKMGGIIDKMAATKGADKVADAIAPCLDILGYNYATSRYEKESKNYPDRVIVGSETLPQSLYRNWQLVKRLPALTGDFIWTGWDYLGEAGLGTIRYQDKKTKESIDPGLMILSGAGVIDICGFKQAEVYWNRAIWGLEQTPHIAVEPITHADDARAASMWRVTDARESWSWEGCEGKKTKVIVYSNADHITLSLNGRTIGTKKVKECKAVFNKVAYEPGRLTAKAYFSDGTEAGTGFLQTATGETRILAKADKELLKANGQDLCFIEIDLTGENGVTKSSADQKLTVSVTGSGRLQGLGSARPNTEETFLGDSYTTYYGKLLAVVRAADTAGDILIKISGDGLQTQELKLRTEE